MIMRPIQIILVLLLAVLAAGYVPRVGAGTANLLGIVLVLVTLVLMVAKVL